MPSPTFVIRHLFRTKSVESTDSITSNSSDMIHKMSGITEDTTLPEILSMIYAKNNAASQREMIKEMATHGVTADMKWSSIQQIIDSTHPTLQITNECSEKYLMIMKDIAKHCNVPFMTSNPCLLRGPIHPRAQSPKQSLDDLYTHANEAAQTRMQQHIKMAMAIEKRAKSLQSLTEEM